MYSVHCTLYNVHYTVYIVQWVLSIQVRRTHVCASVCAYVRVHGVNTPRTNHVVQMGNLA